ncbi:AraC family transcriptional regulator [Amnibacterium kyonggiense]|uniref:AraC-like DNA-binding protein n=1 Tax=Amnibacterium kyonggiense TaxID=595671 RepID=A0A4R7FQ31_9MICO|nr:AraC family transcriptional regulator [Amnibacterium kyonggiense]TDS79689.1 AraC-like DNA-binding protein [Amnibacterium kyonggiense]
MQREETTAPVRSFISGSGESGGRVAVSTHDRGEAIRLLRRAYPHVVLEVAMGDGPFVFRHSSVGDERLRSAELMLTGPARAHGVFEHDGFAVSEVLAGRLLAEYPRTRVDPARPFLHPSGAARMAFEDLHLRMTLLDADAVRAAAERYEPGGAPRRFSRSAPSSAAAAAAWAWAAAHVQRSIRDPHVLDNPIIAGELFDLAVRMLVACFADPADAGASTGAAGAPRAVRRAVAYLEEHALEAVAVPDVAAAARISVRSLQSLFRRHLGVSPVEHLHAIRLEAARKELLAGAEEGGTTVRSVAERWGFGNSGRFARLYQERFGERPSDTLRAHR